MFRRRPGRLLNVLCTFSLCPVSTESNLNLKCLLNVLCTFNLCPYVLESNLNLKCVIKNGLHCWHAKSSKIEIEHPETCNTTHNLEVKFYSKVLLSDSLWTGGGSISFSGEKYFFKLFLIFGKRIYSKHLLHELRWYYTEQFVWCDLYDSYLVFKIS